VYIFSGAEDRQGYLWDRHYHVCLSKFQHSNVVNCVAFKPRDPETLVSVSDDNTIKVWRSRRRHRQLSSANTNDSETLATLVSVPHDCPETLSSAENAVVTA